ncbi:hypothetical protein [Agromyces salentinus]|uniref:ABC transporter ATP-binding protein n=1 Tax=Agromyces salentinus TaxID=269421 RepID=A0ABN2MHU2_9MICO|nr:hypothetical protein [Agromyces salentinus]
MTNPNDDYQPTRRELLRPAEYVGGAVIAALFVGGVALFATRDLVLAAIGAGGVFIVVLMVLALIAMTFKPDADERAEIDGTPGPTDAAGDGRADDDALGTDRPEGPTGH